jgi:hypothetical protein
MASQIAHIVYAKKYFESIENGKTTSDFLDETKILGAQKINRDEFILGTVFPDIRRIEPSIKRGETHLKFPVVNLDFSGLTPFEAGWKFHLYCDMRREEILNKSNFYDLENTEKLAHIPAKLWEDELLYDEYNNWEKLAGYFRNPPIIDAGIAVDRKTFVLWYAILAKYIEEKVTAKTMRVFLSKQPKFSQEIDAIMETIRALKKNSLVKKTLIMVKDEIIK